MAETINIDATNLIVGRLASYAAKQALLGHTVNIFNCEKAVMSGDFKILRERYYHRIFDVGRPFKGPYRSRMPDRFVRWMIRAMVAYKQQRGREAFERIMCYIGVPAKFADAKLIKVGKDVSELPKLKYTTVGDLCVSIGGKV